MEKIKRMNKSTILLVEDDELDIISIQRSLKQLESEFELHIAYNGKEALTMLKEEESINPDVILLDLNMPKMNGIEFLKILRNDNDLKDKKVFIMTTSNDNQDRTITSQLGVSGYIIKPLNYNDNTKKSDSMEAFVQFHLRRILGEG
jgi:CheY-like chemotaxis protein